MALGSVGYEMNEEVNNPAKIETLRKHIIKITLPLCLCATKGKNVFCKASELTKVFSLPVFCIDVNI